MGLEAFMRSLDDAAKRLSDFTNYGLTSGYIGKWIAVRLSDGGTDGVFYDTRADAISHQLHESLCAYLIITPFGMTKEMAKGCLRFYRAAYDAGHRIVDPEQPDVIMPATNEGIEAQINRLYAARK